MKSPVLQSLEKIYSWETINPQTIRKLHVQQQQRPEERPRPTSTEVELTLSFDPSFYEKMLPSRLDEPIQSLSLSPFAQKFLLEKRNTTVRHVIEEIEKGITWKKGIGQSHIEEIIEKTEKFTISCINNSPSIDFVSIIKTVISSIDPKQQLILLKQFQLQHLAATESLYTETTVALPNILKMIGAAFFSKWLDDRLGFASETELYNRLFFLAERSGCTRELAERCVACIQHILGASLFSYIATPCAKKVYARAPSVKEEYEMVCKKALSYFYHPFVSYSFTQLISFVEGAFAQQWVGFVPGFVEKVLRCDEHFIVFKNQDYTTCIKQNFYLSS